MELEPYPLCTELPTHGTYPLTNLDRIAPSEAAITFPDP